MLTYKVSSASRCKSQTWMEGGARNMAETFYRLHILWVLFWLDTTHVFTVHDFFSSFRGRLWIVTNPPSHHRLQPMAKFSVHPNQLGGEIFPSFPPLLLLLRPLPSLTHPRWTNLGHFAMKLSSGWERRRESEDEMRGRCVCGGAGLRDTMHGWTGVGEGVGVHVVMGVDGWVWWVLFLIHTGIKMVVQSVIQTITQEPYWY